jgi:predicted DsbA family dithiol-disulfide isomerase
MWFDYVCPWAYLGRDRTRLMRELGVDVEVRPYELHPEIPREGVEVRPGGRLDRVFGIIGAECEALGIPFVAPVRSRSSRLALETTEVVRAGWPDAYDALDRGLADAYWVEGRDVSSWEVVAELVEAAGAAPSEVWDRVADGEGGASVRESMAVARELGVTATPAWWVNDALLIPGAQPREHIERWITKLQAAAG